MIIDTHVHIWDLQRSTYNWLKAAPDQLNRTYSLSDLQSSRSLTEVFAGVLVQADNSLEDTALMIDAANNFDWIKGVVGWLPLMDPQKTDHLLQTSVLPEIFFKGVRHLIHDEADDEWLLKPAVVESLKLLAACGLPYDLVGVKVSHIKTALKLADKVPDLRLVFDHLNQPPIKTAEKYGEWGIWMKAAAKNPNFYAKISGLGTTAGKDLFSEENIKPYIGFMLEEFGINRCFLGGDWPVSLLAASYADTFSIYRNVFDDLGLNEYSRTMLFSKNAIAFYNLSI